MCPLAVSVMFQMPALAGSATLGPLTCFMSELEAPQTRAGSMKSMRVPNEITEKRYMSAMTAVVKDSMNMRSGADRLLQ